MKAQVLPFSTRSFFAEAWLAAVGATLYIGAESSFGQVASEILEIRDHEEQMLWADLGDDESVKLPLSDELLISADVMPVDAAKLPATLQERPSLAHLALLSRVENPEIYEGGVYGKRGSATVWVGTPESVPDYDRLWWVMVKVLSEKYGCFIVQRQTLNASKVRVSCRDRRMVVFHRARGPEQIMFTGRQFDAQGGELVVRRRQIIARHTDLN